MYNNSLSFYKTDFLSSSIESLVGFKLLNTAEPATIMLAPASTVSFAVSVLIPPSTSKMVESTSSLIDFLIYLIFESTAGIKD